MVESATIAFLAELDAHNERTWFDDNRKRYEAAKKDVAQLVNRLLAGLAETDARFGEVEAKHCMFRIFRDVRFSKNKAPYKTNMGAWMAPGGRKSIYAGYYLHIEPGGKSFLAGGSYMPESKVLKGIREAIDYEPQTLRGILATPAFKSTYGVMEGEQLKTAPKGYPKDHEAIDLLRHKSFVASKKLDDAVLTSDDFVKMALETYAALRPLNDFLNKAIAEVE
jgi:uncharacterized protein (TIGR02453 family)